MDVGDYVHHGPSNENWTVAAVEGDRLYWCGYPFGGSAELADRTMVEAATDEAREKLLKELASVASDERPAILARQRIKE